METWIRPNENQINILQEWDTIPSNGEWKNMNAQFIVRQMLIFQDINDILK